jgi:hypothetical protein
MFERIAEDIAKQFRSAAIVINGDQWRSHATEEKRREDAAFRKVLKYTGILRRGSVLYKYSFAQHDLEFNNHG